MIFELGGNLQNILKIEFEYVMQIMLWMGFIELIPNEKCFLFPVKHISCLRSTTSMSLTDSCPDSQHCGCP